MRTLGTGFTMLGWLEQVQICFVASRSWNGQWCHFHGLIKKVAQAVCSQCSSGH